jgi:hypothetical protein
MSYLTEFTLLTGKSLAVLCAIGAIATVDIARRIRHQTSHLFFAAALGTFLSVGLIRATDLFLEGSTSNPYAAALAVLLLAIGWRTLFGPWEVQTKTVLLVTFLFWISLRMFGDDSMSEFRIRMIAAAIALIPAVVWCRMFLKYHRERLSAVVLLFLAGVLSTVPILFYDSLVRRGVELKFFFFTIKPESFSRASEVFVTGHASGLSQTTMVILATLLSFVFVGLIEEVSKYWVLSRSGKQVFTSIDDVMQLSIMAAIGFAFAENVINPVYFTAFVREYLFHGAAPDIGGFVGNVLGRSVLTSMVHILSTGVMGYFLGLAIFASPVLAEAHAQGRVHRLLHALSNMLRLREVSVFRVQMLTTGLLAAVVLHGAFNFLVTLPDILPGNPQSVADLLGTDAPRFLGNVPLLLAPALLYVVGGFWLLTSLFMRKENIVERGHVVRKEELMQ